MRPARPPRPHCPYCEAELEYWPESIPVHGCNTCLRPLFIHPIKLERPRIYRIQTLFNLAKYATALVALLIFVALATDLLDLSWLIGMTVMALFVHGSMDLTDGILGFKTRIDRTWHRMTPAKAVPIYAALKAIGGTALILLAVTGAILRS